MNTIENLLNELINHKYSESENWTTYDYNGIPVPRISNILSSMLHEEYLLSWANGLGFKRQKYTDARDFAARKGTASHNAIEEFLHSGEERVDFSDIDNDLRFSVSNCYKAFIDWYTMINNNCTFSILDIEKTLVCPYCGGTLDILAKINGRNYIIDLKTSNHMTYKYYIQLGAYMYMATNYYNIQVDGVMILWLNKNRPVYRDYVLDSTVPEHKAMIDQSINTFLSLLYAYYNKNLLVDQYNNIFKGELV